MKTFIISLFISCNLIFPNSGTLAQGWVNNNITEYFEKYVIIDIKYHDGSYWFLTGNGLVEYSEKKFYKYLLSEYSFGKLEKYLTTHSRTNNIFSYLFTCDDTLYLVDNDIHHILKICKREISNITIKDNNNHLLYRTLLSIDIKGRLWLVYIGRSDKEKIDSLCYLDGNRIKNYKCYEKFGIKNIKYFFIKDSSKYILSEQIDDSNRVQMLYIITEDKLVSKNFLGGSGLSWSIEHTYDSTNIFMLDQEYNCYIIDRENNIEYKKLKIDKGPWLIYSFIVLNNKLYITLDGLTVYNLESNKYESTKPDDFNEICLSGFDKIVKIKEKELWLIYGGAYIVDKCNSPKFGFAIYKIK
ncbi:MAG: hypothetical protein ISS16_05715 [Ignavibacteria bacterium]|nr:hypothetical protein [Ignavibacteria bacterium]